MKENDLPGGEAPTAIVIVDDGARNSAIASALGTAGWTVREARPIPADIAACLEQPVALILLGLRINDDAPNIVRIIRTSPGANAMAPILGLIDGAADQHDPKSSEFDGMLRMADEDTALAYAASRWWPVSLAPTRRISAMLGAGPIAGMIERLALRLEAALSALARDPVSARGSIDRAEAHRLAGLCGTLGFAQAHAAWLDLSLGDESALGEVRRTTRLTLAAIARGL